MWLSTLTIRQMNRAQSSALSTAGRETEAMGFLSNAIKAAVISSLGAKLGKGRSPIVTALIMLLATKALSGGSGSPSAASTEPQHEGGLGGLLNKFQQGGLEDLIKSWIGTGPNKAVTPDQLHQALGADTINDLSHETGLSQDELLTQLSRALPEAVDKLTPDGKIPDQAVLLAGPRDESAEREEDLDDRH
jgi:uncharacterized protein YidB (DUF937 family)